MVKIDRRRVVKAYTLIEMLVVVAIIAVLLGLSASTLRNLTQSEGVAAGLPIMRAKFEEARTMAIGRGGEIRVVIHVDGSRASEGGDQVGKFLRYVTLARYDEDGNRWKEMGAGEYLPKNCYFDAELSQKDKGGGSNYVDHLNTSGHENVASGTIPVHLSGETSTSDCYFFEYNSLGIMVNPMTRIFSMGADTKASPRVILSNGQLRRDGGEVAYTRDTQGQRSYAGFVIVRSGETLVYKDLDNISDKD